ncbi:MAG: hypothetical protein ED559_00390 [Phycisphaera sp.]|nr:MAG: hypothetical protein ED559_00390 [Phycisphaera sp.]
MSSQHYIPLQPGTLCTNCGYDLAGLQEGCVCPECGKKRPDPNEHKIEKLDDFCFCASCGYHLVNLKHTDNCPECGLACTESRIKQSLYRSGSGYIKALRRGYHNIRTGYLLFILAVLFGFFGSPALMMLSRATGTNSSPFDGVGFISLVILLLTLTSGIMLLVGAHIATTIDPHLGLHASSERTRRLTRAWAYTNFFFYIPGAFCLPAVVFLAFAYVSEELASIVLLILYFGSAVTLVLSSSCYTLHIAQRLGSIKLIKSCRRITTTLIVLGAIAGFLLLPLIGTITSTPSPTGGAIVGMGFTIGCFAAVVLHCYMVCRVTSGLNAALMRSETIPTKVNSVPGAFVGVPRPLPTAKDRSETINDINRFR